MKSIPASLNSGFESAFRTVEYKARLELLHLYQRAGRSPLTLSRPWSRAKSLLLRQERTDADPFKLLWVNPATINHRSPKSLPIDYGVVEGGGWDHDITPIHETPIYRGLKSWLVEGEDPKKTELYDHFIDELEKHGSYHDHTDLTEFDDRIAELRQLRDQLVDNGYLTQQELVAEFPDSTREKNNDAIHPYLNEVRIDIGRDGKLLWRKGGWHRLSMAKILDLDQIPVFVVTRHRQWQRKRDRIRQGDIPGRIDLSHPDLQDVQH